MWRRGEKLEYLVSGKVPWRTLIPDAKHTWLVPAHGDEYGGLLAIKSMFALQSLGLNTNRDEVVFDFDRSRLTDRVQRFILDYNVEHGSCLRTGMNMADFWRSKACSHFRAWDLIQTEMKSFSLVLLDRLFEIPAREQLQHLRENAAYFVHRLSLLRLNWFFPNPI